MKVTLDQLRDREIPRLVVRSVTMAVCTVEVELEGKTHVLCGRDGQVMRFNGVDHARNSLSELKVRDAFLLHDSPYDEMVGLSDAPSEPIWVPLGW